MTADPYYERITAEANAIADRFNVPRWKVQNFITHRVFNQCWAVPDAVDSAMKFFKDKQQKKE